MFRQRRMSTPGGHSLKATGFVDSVFTLTKKNLELHKELHPLNTSRSDPNRLSPVYSGAGRCRAESNRLPTSVGLSGQRLAS